MIFHPNPMVQDRLGSWEDAHLKKVVVKSVRINNSKNPVRWVVFTRTRSGDLITKSRHISEPMAVVTAQTLANRMYKEFLNKQRASKARKKGNQHA